MCVGRKRFSFPNIEKIDRISHQQLTWIFCMKLSDFSALFLCEYNLTNFAAFHFFMTHVVKRIVERSGRVASKQETKHETWNSNVSSVEREKFFMRIFTLLLWLNVNLEENFAASSSWITTSSSNIFSFSSHLAGEFSQVSKQHSLSRDFKLVHSTRIHNLPVYSSNTWKLTNEEEKNTWEGWWARFHKKWIKNVNHDNWQLWIRLCENLEFFNTITTNWLLRLLKNNWWL